MFPLFETFITLYETLSFTLTAEYLYTTQPTITGRIKKLEQELGVALFERYTVKKQVIPTEQARIFYPKAVKYVRDWEELQESFQAKSASQHSFKIAVSHSASTGILLETFKILQVEIDHLDIEISMHDSDQVFEMVNNHAAHFGIIEKVLSSEQTETFYIEKDELVLAGDLTSDTFFMRESGSGVGYYSRKYLKENELLPKNKVIINNNKIIVSLLEANLGKSIVSKRFLTSEMPYQALSSKYHRSILGVTFLEEKDPVIIDMIKRIKAQLIN